MKEYVKRYIDDELSNILEFMGAVLIVGPKWCGKQQLPPNLQTQ